MDKQYAVYTLSNECHDCYKCIRSCPVKAIKIENGHKILAHVSGKLRMNFIRINAKRVRVDIDRAKNLLNAKKTVFVSLAPSWNGVFEYTPEKMISILKKLGFSEVSETALGAQEVSIKTAEILNNAEKGLFISSACPVIVDYIRLYHPEFVDCITHIGSPAMTHARMLREQFGEDIGIVFIGPCIGKKNEADYTNLIDVALTFDELKIWINDIIKDISAVDIAYNAKFVPSQAYEGALYPIDGGMNETIKKIGIRKDVQLINISGIYEFSRAITELKPENIQKTIFIEALSCEGGCIAGPCTSTNKPSLSIVSDILSNVKEREVIPKKSSTVVEYAIQPKKVVTSQHSLEEILKALKKIGKHSVDDELNCGGCGYATCRDLAKALLDGDAETAMCTSYMRKIAMRKAAAMVRCMPAAIVMVDNSMNIIEANDAFMRMFTGDMYEIFKARPDGLVGAAIDRIVDFADIFRTILKSGKDLHKERYSVNNKLYDINAFTIEPNEIVGAVITDVTQSETNREKIAQKAHEVISKNISIVQEIACLLGEHMVETETLLSSIANDYDDKDEDENESQNQSVNNNGEQQ